MLIELELNTNDSEALLRHAREFQPHSGDMREDRRLIDALKALSQAIEAASRRIGAAPSAAVETPR